MYHDLVFEAAESAFAARGFEATTMQDIAAEAGVSLQTLYSVFDGKRELYDEIRETRREQFREALAGAASERHEDPFQAIEAAVRTYVRFHCDHPDYLRLQLHEGRSWALREAAEPTDVVRWLARLLEDGMAADAFHPGPPERLALAGISLVQVWLVPMLEVGEDETRREKLVGEILEPLRRLYCIEPPR